MLNSLKQKPAGNMILWLVIIIVISLIYSTVSETGFNSKNIAFSEFLERIESGEVSDITIRGGVIDGRNRDGSKFSTLSPGIYPKLIDIVRSKDIRMEIVPTESGMKSFLGTMLVWFPGLLFIGVWIYFMKNMQGGGGAMSFGKSRAKLASDNKKVTFVDVAGIDEAKEELTEIVEFLRDSAKFQKLGARVPRGCLLVGPPGTGKTLLAKAIAGEAGVPFFTISGSDFVEMFVGVGASRVRDMFAQAKKQAPCILFIDEIDAVGRHRGGGKGNANDEREQTLNQILVEMDGFAENEGVIVIAATNREDVLDKALLRPGRFDRRIVVNMPDIKGRKEILDVYIKKVPSDKSVDIEVIARGTPGFSGADLANLINEAALLSARKNRDSVNMEMLEIAKDKVMMGPERKSMVMTDSEKKLTAYHEGGHALVSVYVDGSDPVHKATIIPRGSALGMVMRLPETDRRSVSLKKLKADIAVAMGGRIAEEIIFGLENVTTGASSDIQGATDIARYMIMHGGLSKEIGPVKVGVQSAYGQEYISENMAKKVDDEVKRIVEEGYDVAKKILMKNKDKLDLLANALLEYETLSGAEINIILSGKKLENKITLIHEDPRNIVEINKIDGDVINNGVNNVVLDNKVTAKVNGKAIVESKNKIVNKSKDKADKIKNKK